MFSSSVLVLNCETSVIHHVPPESPGTDNFERTERRIRFNESTRFPNAQTGFITFFNFNSRAHTHTFPLSAFFFDGSKTGGEDELNPFANSILREHNSGAWVWQQMLAMCVCLVVAMLLSMLLPASQPSRGNVLLPRLGPGPLLGLHPFQSLNLPVVQYLKASEICVGTKKARKKQEDDEECSVLFPKKSGNLFALCWSNTNLGTWSDRGKKVIGNMRNRMVIKFKSTRISDDCGIYKPNEQNAWFEKFSCFTVENRIKFKQKRRIFSDQNRLRNSNSVRQNSLQSSFFHNLGKSRFSSDSRIRKPSANSRSSEENFLISTLLAGRILCRVEREYCPVFPSPYWDENPGWIFLPCFPSPSILVQPIWSFN